MINVGLVVQQVAVAGRVAEVCGDPSVQKAAGEFGRDAAQAAKSAGRLATEVGSAWRRYR